MQEVCTVGLYQLQYLTVIEPLTSMLDRQTLSQLYEGHGQVKIGNVLVSVSIQSSVCVAKHTLCFSVQATSSTCPVKLAVIGCSHLRV